ncbi:dihydropteroate synthase [Pseudohongiella sp.]|uniref:dihydropteroate synthase n=1 Tax=marine sediment metagenome TaxID=412755 RepID=A0A0F9Y4S5_9ZZZZ|nr:dihydropteroate synthase [Pseudohongiella sp.]HDZ10120.1 dihydropteroate synthase [Pseudohongiella sp.]HEA63469.1 dihydropteroate synthase [Pseudohongiella sp.]
MSSQHLASGCLAPTLQCGARVLDLSSPRVMGILNVTPDSFSDGGALGTGADAGSAGFFVSVDKALRRTERMVEDGAAIIDVGGESTRPGAAGVTGQQELDRVIPVIEAITQRFDVIVSVDTSAPLVIREAALAGAGLINDIRALRRDGAIDAVAATSMGLCLMHMKGEPGTMQQAPVYDDLLAEVLGFLQQRVSDCERAGIARGRICLDPGFGFGKTLAHNYRLLRELPTLLAAGLPVLAGISRKSMIGAVVEREVDGRLPGSLAAAVLAAEHGASIIRVHDVAETVDALKVLQAMQSLP